MRVWSTVRVRPAHNWKVYGRYNTHTHMHTHTCTHTPHTHHTHTQHLKLHYTISQHSPA